jgi:hypothetical protein
MDDYDAWPVDSYEEPAEIAWLRERLDTFD